MNIEKIKKWHETKSLSLASDICEDLYDNILHYCEITDKSIDELDDILPILISKI